MQSKGINTDAVTSIQNDIKKQEHILVNNNSCFDLKSANQWINEASQRPIPNMLFGHLWFERELCILFADTNVGKSVLAVQIAEGISKGRNVEIFKVETKPQKTIYFDFELSDKQFEKRYSDNYTNHYVFSSNLIRAEINTEDEMPKSFKTFEDYLMDSLTKAIVMHKAKVIIIDNLTYLKEDNERAKDALPLMKHLKSLNKQYGVSILVLAHTPKRDFSKPLSKNDISGSKMLINFCDSAFAIGDSTLENSYRYVKQIKQRNTECVYHKENVAVFEIIQDVNFLKFQFLEFDEEINHLALANKENKKDRLEDILELKNQGLSNVEIAERLGVSEGTIRYNLKKQ